MHVDSVRRALLELPAAGVGSFEDLIAHVMTEQFGRPFQLSASGTQHGCDGATVDDGPMLAFEAKRYNRRSLNINELRGKIAEISDNPSRPCNLWMLATTKQITVQTDRALRIDLARVNSRYYAFDWYPGPRLPKLFVFFLIHGDAVITWFKRFQPEIAGTIEQALRSPEWHFHRADIEQIKRELAALGWDAETLIQTFVGGAMPTAEADRSDFETSAIDICLKSIEFVKLGATKPFNQLPIQIIVLRRALTATATYWHYFGTLDEEDVINALRAVDHQTSDFIAIWGDVHQAPDLKTLIDGVRQKHRDLLDKFGTVPGASAMADRHLLYLASQYEVDFVEELERIAQDLATLEQNADVFERPESTRDELKKLIYKISMHVVIRPIDLAVITALINRIDVALDDIQEDLSHVGRRIIHRCRRAFGKIIKHRLLPDLTTFQLPGLAHDFILFDRPIANVARLVFALSRYPISEKNLELLAPVLDIVPDPTELPDETLSFDPYMLDPLVERLYNLSVQTGLSLGLPASCHYQCLLESSALLPSSILIAGEKPILTDSGLHDGPSPRVARLFIVPWLRHVAEPKPHDYDYYDC